jgi:hypothetical protein
MRKGLDLNQALKNGKLATRKLAVHRVSRLSVLALFLTVLWVGVIPSLNPANVSIASQSGKTLGATEGKWGREWWPDLFARGWDSFRS